VITPLISSVIIALRMFGSPWFSTWFWSGVTQAGLTRLLFGFRFVAFSELI